MVSILRVQARVEVFYYWRVSDWTDLSETPHHRSVFEHNIQVLLSQKE